MEQTVEITMNTWISLLEKRREEIRPRGWLIPDCIWNYVIKLFKDCGPLANPVRNSPDNLVDNIAVNSDFGTFDDYRKPGESDEELIARMKYEAIAVFPEEEIILRSL